MNDQSRIEVKYSYQLSDVLRAFSVYIKIRPNYKFKRISSIIFVVVNIINLLSFVPIFVISLIANSTTQSPAFDSLVRIGFVITILFFVLLIISIIGLFQPITQYRIRRAFKSNSQIYADKYEVVVDGEGIRVNLPGWKSILGWSRIEGVYEYDQGFLVLYTFGDYLALPKRAFVDEIMMDEFVSLATRMKEAEVQKIP